MVNFCHRILILFRLRHKKSIRRGLVRGAESIIAYIDKGVFLCGIIRNI